MLKRLVVGAIFVLAACSPAEEVPSGPGGIPVTPTIPPPTWSEPVAPVTLDNVAQVTYLGRLDAEGTPSTMFAYAISPDGTRLAGLTNDLLVVWNLVTGELVANRTRDDATEVFYAPDKTEIYTLDNSGLVQVFDAEQGRVVTSFRAHTRFNGSVAYDTNRGLLAIGGDHGEIKLWDMAERQSLVAFNVSEQGVSALAFSDDGTLLAGADRDGMVYVWRWPDKIPLARLDNEGAVPVRVAISPDMTQLAAGTEQFIALWSLADGARTFTLQTGRGGSSDVLKYAPDGSVLVNGGIVPNMTIWNPQSGEMITGLPGVGGDRTSAAFSPDGALLLTSVMSGGVTIWNTATLGSEALSYANLDVGDSRILYVDWTDDGFLMIFVDATGPVYLWGIGPG